MLDPAQGFEAANIQGGVQLLNYREPYQTAPPFQGVCDELTYSIGKALEKLLMPSIDNAENKRQPKKPQYKIMAGRGTYVDYFQKGTHYFLLAWPRSKSETVQNALRYSNSIPQDCLIVDPSFGNLIPPGMTTGRDRFKLNSLLSLDMLSPDNTSTIYPRQRLPIALPLGYVCNIVPQVVSDFGKQAMLFLNFMPPTMKGSSPLVSVVIKCRPQDNHVVYGSAIFQKTSPEHVFRQFFSKIIHNLNPQMKRHFDESLAEVS